MNPNKDRFQWGIVIAQYKPGNPTQLQMKSIGEWVSGYGTSSSKNGHVLYRSKKEAEKQAGQWSEYDWGYAPKKYPLHRKP